MNHVNNETHSIVAHKFEIERVRQHSSIAMSFAVLGVFAVVVLNRTDKWPATRTLAIAPTTSSIRTLGTTLPINFGRAPPLSAHHESQQAPDLNVMGALVRPRDASLPSTPSHTTASPFGLLALALATVATLFVRWATKQPTEPTVMAMVAGGLDCKPGLDGVDLEAPGGMWSESIPNGSLQSTAGGLFDPNPRNASSGPRGSLVPLHATTSHDVISSRDTTKQLLDNVLGKLDKTDDVPTRKEDGRALATSPTNSTVAGPYKSRTLSREMQPNGYSPSSPQGWTYLRTYLQGANVRHITPERLKAGGHDFVVLDLRDEKPFRAGHIAGAYGVLLFQPDTSSDFNWRHALLKMVGFSPTVENLEFMQQVSPPFMDHYGPYAHWIAFDAAP